MQFFYLMVSDQIDTVICQGNLMKLQLDAVLEYV